jgi:hypothetical protein
MNGHLTFYVTFKQPTCVSIAFLIINIMMCMLVVNECKNVKIKLTDFKFWLSSICTFRPSWTVHDV